MKNSIESLEAQLNSAVSARPAALDAIASRVTAAQETVENFRRVPSPSAAQIDKALAALTSIEGCTKLVAILGDTKPWTASVQDQWLSDNFDVLVGELEKKIEAEAAKRNEYREAAALEIGRLSAEVVRLDGNGAPENELSRMSKKLAEIESDLERREGRLRFAKNALMSFARATTERPNTYMSRYDLFKAARDAVSSVSFSEVPLPREHVGASVT